MALNKRVYISKETVVTASNLNEIQDCVIALESNATNVDNEIDTLNTKVNEITENFGAIPFADERPEDLAANSLWFDTSEEDPGKAIHAVEKYDVGDIFITTREGDPAELLGYGTWQQIKDRFLLAAGDSYEVGVTGGEATHTLTVEEMPSHSHNLKQHEDGYSMFNADSSGGSYIGDNQFMLAAKRKIADVSGANNVVSTTNLMFGEPIASTGGGQAHNNMPPYLAVYMWLRTA